MVIPVDTRRESVSDQPEIRTSEYATIVTDSDPWWCINAGISVRIGKFLLQKLHSDTNDAIDFYQLLIDRDANRIPS